MPRAETLAVLAGLWLQVPADLYRLKERQHCLPMLSQQYHTPLRQCGASRSCVGPTSLQVYLSLCASM